MGFLPHEAHCARLAAMVNSAHQIHGASDMMRTALTIAALALSVPATATTITFEEPGVPTAMSNSPGAAVPVASRLDNQYLSLGVVFGSGAGYAAVVDHGYPALTPTPPNIIGGTAAGGTLSYSTPITATFYLPNSATNAVTNSVKVLGDLFGLGRGTATLIAYDKLGNILGTVTDGDNKPLGQGPVLSFSAPGIHSVSFFSDNATVGFDNFEFGALAAAVPEPASWALMLFGFGAIGATVRRRARIAIA